MANCNCIEMDEEKIKEWCLKNNNAESVEKVSFQNLAFMINGGNQLYSEVMVMYNERNKKGELKKKKKKVNISYNFCPMCGKSYKE